METHSHENIAGCTYSRFEWLDNHNAVKSRMRSDVISDLPIYPGDQVLDVGCGVGYWSLLAGTRVGVHGSVVGVDCDPESIALAESRSQTSVLKQGVRFDCSAIESYPIEPASFDVILLFNVLSYVSDPLACLRRILPALRPNGRLFIKDTDLQSDFFHPVPLDLYFAVLKAAIGGPSRAVVGNFDPFFARQIVGLLHRLPAQRIVTRSYSFSVFNPSSPEERRFIKANAEMLSEMASANGAHEVADAWHKLFAMESANSVFEKTDFLYSMNEFVFQIFCV